jgi:hypothetical protein
MKTFSRLALVFIGAHLLLGMILLAIEATHGINDQDASFAVALLFHGLNYPVVWLLRCVGIAPGMIVVLLAGIAQWALAAMVVAGGYRLLTGGMSGKSDGDG